MIGFHGIQSLESLATMYTQCGRRRSKFLYPDSYDPYEIYFLKYPETDVTGFFDKLYLSGAAGGSVAQTAISCSNVYAVWSDNSPGNWDIFFKRSTDSGANFGAPINLSNSDDYSSDARIVASGTNVYIVWVETDFSTGSGEAFFRRSTDSVATFGPIVKVEMLTIVNLA